MHMHRLRAPASKRKSIREVLKSSGSAATLQSQSNAQTDAAPSVGAPPPRPAESVPCADRRSSIGGCTPRPAVPPPPRLPARPPTRGVDWRANQALKSLWNRQPWALSALAANSCCRVPCGGDVRRRGRGDKGCGLAKRCSCACAGARLQSLPPGLQPLFKDAWKRSGCCLFSMWRSKASSG